MDNEAEARWTMSGNAMTIIIMPVMSGLVLGILLGVAGLLVVRALEALAGLDVREKGRVAAGRPRAGLAGRGAVR